MGLWLHETCGYTFFNIPNLTYVEIKSLIDAKMRQVRKQRAMQRREESKARAKRRR